MAQVVGVAKAMAAGVARAIAGVANDDDDASYRGGDGGDGGASPHPSTVLQTHTRPNAHVSWESV